MMKKINRETVVAGILVAVVCYLIFFLRLDSFQVRPWDESIYANSAFEMIKSGNYFVPLHHGLPDMYNSKPLLAIWIQVVFIKALGFNELAIRLPSAIAATITCIVLFLFLRKNFGGAWAWSSFFILISSAGFIHFHSARTGDMDALLALFLTCSFFSFFNLITEEKLPARSVLLFFIFLGLAFATKSFAALLFLPAQFFVLLYYKKIISLLKNPMTYAGILAFFIIGILPLLIRNARQPGYIDYLIHTDAFRVSQVKENHNEPFDFYFANLFNWRFSLWIFFAFAGMLLMIRSAEQHIKKTGVACMSCIFSFLLIISFSSTKLEWYDVPLFPLLAICAGYPVLLLLRQLNAGTISTAKQYAVLLLAFFIPLFFAVKKSIGNDIPNNNRKEEELTTYIFMAGNQHVSLDNWSALQGWHTHCLEFYQHKLEGKEKLNVLTGLEQVHPGDQLLVADDSLKKLLAERFDCKTEPRYKDVDAITVLSEKLSYHQTTQTK